jgi:hypothetical protein
MQEVSKLSSSGEIPSQLCTQNAKNGNKIINEADEVINNINILI